MSREIKRCPLRRSWGRSWKSTFESWRWRCAVIFCGALGFNLTFANHAQASFVGPYALANFTLNNSSTCALDTPDGSIDSPDNGVTAVLTGSTSGSGCSGMTDLVINANGTGLVQFHYYYSSLEVPTAEF